MSYRLLHQAVVDKLKATTGITDLAVDINYAHTKFTGFPSIAVANSSNENDYQANDARRRTYGFSIYVYDLFNDNDDYEASVKKVEDLMDQVIEVFNSSDALQPTALQTQPVPASLITTDAGDEGVYTVGEVIVRCTVYEGC